MPKTIMLTGRVLVSDIALALEPILSEETLKRFDKETKDRSDDRLEFDDTEVLAHHAVDELEEAGELPEPEGPDFGERDIIGLAEAIRCGEREEAELLLDRVFAEMPNADTIREWIDRGRYSMKARKAKALPAKPQLRNAA